MILNKKNKTTRIVLYIVLIVLVFLVILFTNIVSELKNGEQTLSKMTFTDIDITFYDGIQGCIYSPDNLNFNIK